MKVVFFGSSHYCLPLLDALKENLIMVITREDKPVGRKQIMTPSAVKIWANKNSVPFSHQMADILDCDLAIVADFGKIIPEKIFDKPKLKTFNIHFSKLPDLRGASPVQTTLLRSDTTAWISIFKIEKTLDTGPILDQREFPILPDDTSQTLYTRLFQEVAKYISSLDFSAKLTPQTGTPTFCKMLKRDDGFIPWEKFQISSAQLADQIYNAYRAFYPWPGLWTLKNGKRMKILKCHLEKDKLILDEIQFDGEKPKKFSDKLIL